MLVAVKAPGARVDEAQVLSIFDGRIARWQVPDKVVFVEVLPRNATGKVLKRNLREIHADCLSS